jgi:hypothetical protein
VVEPRTNGGKIRGMNPMRCIKWMLPLWLLCQASLALADWEVVDENHLAVVYIDPDKIRASSVFPQAWHLIDLNDKSKAFSVWPALKYRGIALSINPLDSAKLSYII